MSKKTLQDNSAEICETMDCFARNEAKTALKRWIEDQSVAKQKVTLDVFDRITSSNTSADKSSQSSDDRTLAAIQAEFVLKGLRAQSVVDHLNIPKGKEGVATELIADALSKSWDEKHKSGEMVTLAADTVEDSKIISSIQKTLDSGSKPTFTVNSPSKSLEMNF